MRPSAPSTSVPNAAIDCGERRLSRLDDLARDDVRIDHRHAARCEEVRDGGLAARDAAGECDAERGSMVSSREAR